MAVRPLQPRPKAPVRRDCRPPACQGRVPPPHDHAQKRLSAGQRRVPHTPWPTGHYDHAQKRLSAGQRRVPHTPWPSGPLRPQRQGGQTGAEGAIAADAPLHNVEGVAHVVTWAGGGAGGGVAQWEPFLWRSAAPSWTCWFHEAEAKPLSTWTISMQSGTGQTIWQRLQPTHSDSSTTGTRDPSVAGWRHWCAPSWQATTHL
jgi:hypothetical protein